MKVQLPSIHLKHYHVSLNSTQGKLTVACYLSAQQGMMMQSTFHFYPSFHVLYCHHIESATTSQIRPSGQYRTLVWISRMDDECVKSELYRGCLTKPGRRVIQQSCEPSSKVLAPPITVQRTFILQNILTLRVFVHLLVAERSS